MKTYPHLIITIASFVLLASVSPAWAQYNLLVANVPFEFKIGETSLPPGSYRVSRVEGHTNVLLLRSVRRGIFVFGYRDESQDRNETPRLVFHRYGDQYFLREIRFLGSLAMNLPETVEEQEAQRRADRSGSDLETVAVVAQLE
jgi:hypothetical protein